MNFQVRSGVGRPQSSGSRPSRIQGVSLIEVMVAVFVLAVGLLGMAAMQSLAIRGVQGSLESSQAVMQTYAITEAMRANSANAADYNMGMTCNLPSGGTLAQNDQRAWITSLKATIGNDVATCGQIAGCPDACQITVQWNDERAGGGATRQLVTRARI